MEPHYYEVNLGWQYARLGQLSAPGLTDTIDVATPPNFRKECLTYGRRNICW